MDIRTFFSSKGKRWTDEEVIQLLTLVRKKESHDSIAKTLGRTPGAVHSHLKKLAAEYYENDGMSIDTIQKMVGLSHSIIEEAIQKKTTKTIEKSHYAFYDTVNGSSGVFTSWDEIRPHVTGQKGRLHKGFACEEDAHIWIANQDPPVHSMPTVPTVYKEPELSPEQKEAFDAIRAGESVFLTGPGGTGKTFLIDHIRKEIVGKVIAVTALTGCAALLLGSDAKTIFSWAGIGLGKDSREKYVNQLRMMKHLTKRWRDTDILIIDEVSMMTPELLELLEYLGRTVRPKSRTVSPLPFGGLQVVLVGDFLQLPPVEKGEQQFAFESPVWNQSVKRTIQLKRIYRQTDTAFQKVLDEARTATLSAASYALLESRMNLPWKDELIKPTLLFTRRAAVDAINQNSLAKLTGETQTYTCRTLPVKCALSEVAKVVEKMDRDANYVVDLSLKVGAQVMLLKNLEPEAGLVNGSRGVVVAFQEFAPYLPKVQFKTCTRLIKPEIWASNHEPPIQREQIPLRLAYALTIHKAQGASLDSALVDIGDSTFEYGQAYVALSRVRSLEGLYVHDLSPAAFRAHPTVKAFYEGTYVRKPPTPPPTTIPDLNVVTFNVQRQTTGTFVDEEVDAPPVPSRTTLFGKK